MRVAVIGLGTMGLPMARHLVAAGHDVVGCDLDSTRVDALGARRAETPAEAAAAADVVLLSLPSPAAVEEVVLGTRGVRTSARPGTLLVDMSTSPPSLARRLAAECPELDVLDAPVSGGPRGASDATLTIMVGGAADAFERARPLFELLGGLVVLVGGHGAGQAAKLCNNLIAGATMAAIAESCAIAVREGIDPRILYELLTASTGDSRVLRTRFPLPGVDDAHPASNGLRAALRARPDREGPRARTRARRASTVSRSPVAEAALDAYRAAQRDGLGALDYSAVYLRAPRRGSRRLGRHTPTRRRRGAMADPELVPEAIHEQDGLKVSKSPWGADDEIGRLNWVTPESTAAILDHLDGRHVFDLNVEYFIGMPSWVAAGDPAVRHLDDPHAAGLGQRQPLGRRLRGARDVLVLRRLDPHVHPLRDAHRHAQPPRLLREVLERLGGRPRPRQPDLEQGRARQVPAGDLARRAPRRRRHARRRRPSRRLRDHAARTCRTPSRSRASSCARATSCSSARGG